MKCKLEILIAFLCVGFGATYADEWMDEDGRTWSYYNGTITGVSPADGELVVPQKINGSWVTGIEGQAFKNCSGLHSIVIPESVMEIGGYAFEMCASLKAVRILNADCRVSSSTFAACGSIELMTIPSCMVNRLYDYSSFPCLTNLVVCEGVSNIPQYAFYTSHGSALEIVVLPDSVKSIDSRAFYCCEKLRSVNLGEGLETIGEWAFTGCKCLQGVEFPASVVRIGECAFGNCESLEHVRLPPKLTEIAEATFRYCAKLKNVTFNPNLTNIESSAFLNCQVLSNVELPPLLAHIGELAFSGCKSLECIEIPSGVSNIDGSAFSYSGLHNIILNDGVTCIGDSAFFMDVDLKEIVLPNSVISLGEAALSSCTSLTNVVLSSGISSIGRWFNGCVSLKTVSVPSSVEAIDDFAFQSCSSLDSFVIPRSVASVGEFAFYDCYGLKSVRIPSSVLSIGSGVFQWCSGLMTIYVDNGDVERVKGMLEDSGRDVESLSFVEQSATPVESMEQLKRVFGEKSDAVANITNEQQLAAFNVFLEKCDVTSAESLDEARRRWAYQSFKLSEIVVAPQLFDVEPKLVISDFRPSGTDFALTVSLTAGGEEIALAKDALRQKIRSGVSPDSVDDHLKDEDIISAPSQDGVSLTFTVKPPSGERGFLKIGID